MKRIYIGLLGLLLTGCTSTANKMTQSASGKNLNLDGYVMLGKVETANAENGTPTGEMIMGRVSYKSRRVGIPADQKVRAATPKRRKLWRVWKLSARKPLQGKIKITGRLSRKTSCAVLH